ncbi:MAG TPA: hypothetical protein VEB69_08470 [Acidimicrobiia bacterium]|nr:hypothetical protein [Acidimicrobiia bacterium]
MLRNPNFLQRRVDHVRTVDGTFRKSGLVIALSLSLFACSPPDSGRATEIFADCLQRNGVEAEDVEVVLNSDGSVGSISARIVSEGGVAYEPTVRLACTEEVELSQ